MTYLTLDILLTADVMQNFRASCIEAYGLDSHKCIRYPN